jgi:hypothetical protein
MNERPPPHSTWGISASRDGGKRVPKQYRKYHKNPGITTKKKKKEKGQIASRMVHYVIKMLDAFGR